MKIYGIYDKVLEDFVMVTLAPNDKSVIRGLRCPEGFNPAEFDIVCLGKPNIDHQLGLMSDFVRLTEQGGVDPQCIRKLESEE